MAKSAAYYALCDHGMNISRISFGQESVWSQCFDLSRIDEQNIYARPIQVLKEKKDN